MILETTRLYLREHTTEDAENAYLLNSDPEVIKYTGDLAFISIDEARDFLEKYNHYEKYGFGRWAVIEKATNVYLGWCGLKYSPELDEFDIGFRVMKKYWNKGYATEAAMACLEIGFKRFGMKIIVGRAMKENLASIKVLQKIGLTFLEERVCGGNDGVVLRIKKIDFIINHKINSSRTISKLFIKREIYYFQEALNFVRYLPYGRNANKEDLTTVFTDGCGTCSTKHALLKQLAIENKIDEVKLIVGLFKMNTKNTPEVANTLKQNNLDYIPEAHCYLRIENEIIDVMKANSKPEDFVHDLIEEIEIEPNQITDFKVAYHKKYLEKWLKENSELKFTLNEIWAIREQCIQDLSKEI